MPAKLITMAPWLSGWSAKASPSRMALPSNLAPPSRLLS